MYTSNPVTAPTMFYHQNTVRDIKMDNVRHIASTNLSIYRARRWLHLIPVHFEKWVVKEKLLMTMAINESTVAQKLRLFRP